MKKGCEALAKSKVTDVVRELAEPIVSELNLELFDVEFVKRGTRLVPESLHRQT